MEAAAPSSSNSTLVGPDTRKRRIGVFILIVLLHGLLIEALRRESEQFHFTGNTTPGALVIYLLPRAAPRHIDIVQPEKLSRLPREDDFLSRIAPALLPTPRMETTPATPEIDWQGELKLAAQNALSGSDKERAYRDLAKSMSPSQLDWLKKHHMEPASPGLTWKSPRVEITQDGLPIVHINDHCVLVPLLLLPMVFCSIGHIEPKGDLFEHMHDPAPP